MMVASSLTTQLRRLTEVSRKLTYACSVEEILTLTVERAAELLDAERAILVFMDEEGTFVSRASYGLAEGDLQRFSAPLDALTEKLRSVLAVDHFLGVPLVIEGIVTGVLAVSRTPDWDGDDREEWLLSALADQAAVAIERNQAEEAGDLRERLVGIVGHDLRNPINAISAAAALLARNGNLAPQDRPLVQRIARSADHMSDLIKQMLDFTRLRLGGGLPLAASECDLLEIVCDVIDELELANPGRVIGLRADGVGDARGFWDRGRVAQILSNLIGNAIQHGAPDQPITVRVQPDGGDLLLSIHNHGDPIPPDTIPVLFDPFRQGTGKLRTKSSTSLGLGLFIVQHIAKGHGGEITVRSTEVEGTTFNLRLPQRPSSDASG